MIIILILIYIKLNYNNILFFFYKDGSIKIEFIKYQFRKNFNGKNFIYLGQIYTNNFIAVKKNIDDDSLILYVNNYY